VRDGKKKTNFESYFWTLAIDFFFFLNQAKVKLMAEDGNTYLISMIMTNSVTTLSFVFGG
jgi:hypothetical protein